MFSTSLLLLLAAASYVHGVELTQPASMTVQPGQSLSINCKVSYSVTGYYTAFIRQPPGKTLEWIGYIAGSSTAYSDKFKNKFSLSTDTSTNTVTIRGQNMQAEDTAVYYCARRHSDTHQQHPCTKTSCTVYIITESTQDTTLTYLLKSTVHK
ncbi:hypothetical protein C0J50_2632 [Silurus asotus]|uniref:Ig-like domain-containing protein n=1 Tax=Silurus asotus TaxID=30991 RepID=A0AAD5FTU5_SILAS|nr:hypothetical protein C0J50_2632 [Silurus asotus]